MFAAQTFILRVVNIFANRSNNSAVQIRYTPGTVMLLPAPDQTQDQYKPLSA